MVVEIILIPVADLGVGGGGVGPPPPLPSALEFN